MVVRVDGELAEALADGTGDLPAPLAELAVLLRGNPDLRVVVEGHTDSVGEGGYNQRMSERLAEAVRDAMIQSGIDARRLRAIGRGEEDPLASNATELGRRLNHRIEIVVAIPRELAERLTAELEPRFAAAMAMQP